MIPRSITINKNYSFFLFGPRGSGKSSLLKKLFPQDKNETLWIDLLEASEEENFQKNPDDLLDRTKNLKPNSWVVIDEIQKVPKLLDLVHKLIEEKKLLFALSGSSARKLKRGAANLLAGRAFVFYLFPFSYLEIKSFFNLEVILTWGTLPKIFEFINLADKKRFLQAYSHTYLREEIQIEQIVRNLPGFRRFLEVAAQMNGQPINYQKIGRDINLDHSVVRNYYEILEDTLIGFSLPAYEASVRKQQKKSSKFYFIDLGIKRTLSKMLDVPLVQNTYEFGRAFEHFFILEMYKLCKMREKEESLFHLRTKGGLEIDLIIERPGKKTLFIEIKASTKISKDDASALIKITKGNTKFDAYLISRDKHDKIFENVRAYSWEKFIEYFNCDKI